MIGKLNHVAIAVRDVTKAAEVYRRVFSAQLSDPMPQPEHGVTFFLLWWVGLFAAIPWGVRSQQEHGTITPGSDPGAPAIPGLKRKLVWTTVVAGCVFAAWQIVFAYRLIPLDDLSALIGFMPR